MLQILSFDFDLPNKTMGAQESSSQMFDDKWQEIQQQDDYLPGQPQIVRSIRSHHLLGEKFCLEITNTNFQQQIQMYQQRKMNIENVVSLYDFEVTKPCLGCARNVSCYNVITERIPYRLSQFSNLTHQQTIYILHESLNGYNQLSKFGKICHPEAEFIGIKNNAEIKIWTSNNWSQNSYRKARDIHSSIDSLFNAILMKSYQNAFLQSLKNKLSQTRTYQYQNIISLLRTLYKKQIFQGKFSLEKRIQMKNFNGEIKTIPSEMRLRSYSEDLRKNARSMNSSVNMNHTAEKSRLLQERSYNGKKNIISRSTIIQTTNHTLNSNSLQHNNQNNMDSSYHKGYHPVESKVFHHEESPNRTSVMNNQLQKPHLQQIVIQKKQTPSLQQHNNRIINFNYNKDINVFENKIEEMKHWKNDRTNNKNAIYRTILNGANNQTTIKNKRNQHISTNRHKIGEGPMVEAFQLELKLDQNINRQVKGDARKETAETWVDKEDKNTLQNKSSSLMNGNDDSQDLINCQEFESPQSTKRLIQNNTDQTANRSKQIAEQFKFYLQSSKQEQANKKPLSLEVTPRRIEEEQNNSRCIIERWDEEESFYS